MYKKYIPFLLLLISTLSFGQNIHFQAIGVENGISQPTVTSIYQDEFGIIWIGTKDGLNRYNGTDFHIFRPIENDKNSLYNNNIGTICGDKNGHIYIRCKYAVVEYDIRKNIFHTIRNNNIQAIDYGNSRLWVCTRDSLFTYNRKEDKLEYYYHLDSVRISCVTEDHEGNLYVGTMNKGLYIIDSNKKWLNYLPEKDITCIYEDSKKNIWVGTKDDGLFRLDRNGVQINYKDGPYKNRLSSNYIRCIVEDNQGNYWIGTFKGLDKLDTTNNITHYSEDNKPYSLSNSSIICMMKDQQGTFWIGTYYGGINLFNPDYEIYTYYYPDESQKGKLTSPFAGRMKEDSKGGIWIATEGGGVNYLDRKTKSFIEYKHSNQSNSLASNTIQALYLDEKNQIVQGQASELSKKADQLFQATEGEFEYQMQKKKYQVVYRVSDTTKWKVIGIIPLREISADLLPIQKQMIKTLMIGIFISSILSFLLSYVIVRPIRATVLAMHRFSEGDFEVRLSEERKDEFGEMNRVFNETTRKIEELMHEVTNSKLLNKEMEFKALQAQINPHFLYNALDTVNWMAMKKGDTEICDMVSAISNLMRISIGNKQDIFSIRQELKYVKDYLYIQETRYRDRFQVYFAIDEKILDEKIPKLTIQPLVENAIVHSVEVSKGKTVLNINGYIEQGNVVIEIKDDGVGMDRDTLLHLLDPPEGEEKDISVAHTGLGMYAVHQRLRYLYGEEYGLTADSEPGNGTCIKICIPFTKGEEKTWS